MPFLGPCAAWHCPGIAAVQPATAAAVYPGACKFVGYNALAGQTAGAGFATKGMCLGLGVGLGAWGPLMLLGAAVVGGYLILKRDSVSAPATTSAVQDV